MLNTIIPNQDKIENIFIKEQIKFVALFGSRAKNTANHDSDFDLLIEYASEKKYTLLDIVALKTELEDILGKNVDLITTNGINSKMENEIQMSKKVIYDAR